MKDVFHVWVAATAVAAGLLAPVCAAGESAAGLVRSGNQAYHAGRYDDALTAYGKASVEKPDSPEILFNRGTAVYRKGDYTEAARLFAEAARTAEDLPLVARAHYDLGNCHFRESERQRDSDLKKSLGECEKSIACYQEALKHEPGLKEAAENIEVARMTMKAILDALQKKEQENAGQKEEQKKIVDKLKELADKQDKLAARNRGIEKEKAEKGESDDVRGQVGDLGRAQRDLRREGADLPERIRKAFPDAPPPQGQGGQQQQQQQVSPGEEARQRLEEAARRQDAAGDQLDRQQLEPARPDQEQAAQELKKAVEALTRGQDQQQGGKQDPQNNQQQQPDGQEQQPPPEQNGQNDQQQEQAAAGNDTARDIIDQEKANRDRRERAAGGYAPVDRDW